MPVIEMNKTAYDELHCIKEMKIITGASHLFEEPENCQRSLILRLPGIKKINKKAVSLNSKTNQKPIEDF
jgi:hypothetical protein